jgi:hypothetical protein
MTAPRRRPSSPVDATSLHITPVPPIVVVAGLVLGVMAGRVLLRLDALEPLGLHAPPVLLVSVLAVLTGAATMLGSRLGTRAAGWLVLAFEIGMLAFGTFTMTSRFVDRAEAVMEHPIAALSAPAATRPGQRPSVSGIGSQALVGSA